MILVVIVGGVEAVENAIFSKNGGGIFIPRKGVEI